MIRNLVDFALNNRYVVLAIGVLLLIWGAVSFHNMPVEAYPDIADNYVNIISQWPGHSAEEMEQQVSVPVEIQVFGIPHLTTVRSESIFGLSLVTLIFDDQSVNDWNRSKVLERLTQVNVPAGVVPQIGTDWSMTGQIYWYTIRSNNPAYDLMNLRSIEDWTLYKEFRKVGNVVDVSDFGGTAREYQVRIDPNKLISYGLSISQVESQLASNNVNAGGSFVEEGLQQLNVRALGLYHNVQDIENTVLTTAHGVPVRVKDIAVVEWGPKIRLGHMARADHRPDGVIVDEPDVIQAGVLMRKGAEEGPTLEGIHQKVDELNNHILPEGVKIIPMLDRSDLLHYTLHTVLHNLGEGMILVTIILFLFLGNVRGAFIVALTIPFSLLFASIFLDLSKIPANLISLGALDFGMVVDGAVVMMENIMRHMSLRGKNGSSVASGRITMTGKSPIATIRDACHEVQRPVFFAIAIIITAYMPIFTLQRVEGRLFRPMAWTVAFALLGAIVFSIFLVPVLAALLFPHGVKEWRNPVMEFLKDRYRGVVKLAIQNRWITVGVGLASVALALFLTFSGVIGSEFLPHLDEGAIWARGAMANSVTALAISRMHGREMRVAREAASHKSGMEQLYELSRSSLLLDLRQPQGPQLAVLIHRIFNAQAVALFDVNLSRQDRMGDWEAGDEDLAKECYLRDASQDDASTQTWQRILRAGPGSVGALVVRGKLSPLVVDALASLAAIAIDRHQWFDKEERAETSKKGEQLRATVMDALAHEFKTPLTAVQTASSGLLELGGLTECQDNLVRLIDGEAIRLNKLCTQLLKAAKLEAKQVGLDTADVKVVDLVHEVLADHPVEAGRNSIRVVVADSSLTVRADRELLAMILTQYIDNARKYSTVGTPIEIDARAGHNEVLFSVRNFGSVIRIEDRERIFERFYRSSEYKDAVAGTGIGLSVVKKAAEAHHGHVWVISDNQEGTTFYFSLPTDARRTH